MEPDEKAAALEILRTLADRIERDEVSLVGFEARDITPPIDADLYGRSTRRDKPRTTAMTLYLKGT